MPKFIALYLSTKKMSEKTKLNTPQLVSSIEQSNVSIWYDTTQQHPHQHIYDLTLMFTSMLFASRIKL
jgi:hypothetical protein